MQYPTQLQLLEFFSVEPLIHDDVSVYTVSEDSGLTLTLSFNTSDDSLQTSLTFEGRAVAVVCQEGMTRLWISDGMLIGEFLHADVHIKVIISRRPFFRVEWSGLKTGQ